MPDCPADRRHCESVEAVHRHVPWRDLLTQTWLERAGEVTLSLPWLILSLAFYSSGWPLAGAVCSFYFFLTGLRQSHGAQHYSLGLSRRAQDWILFALSVLMLGSMHAVQVSHLHHHRHCLDDDDTEGSTARLPWWQAILVGPFFIVRLHRSAWALATSVKRRWILAELVAGAIVITVALVGLSAALSWHVTAMMLGECLTGFFAVWTVHHDCESPGPASRTQRGRWINWIYYSMFFHAEHHLFPQVPTCHLGELANRLDAATPHLRRRQVIGSELPSRSI